MDGNQNTVAEREAMRPTDWIILAGMALLTGLWVLLLVVVGCSLWELVVAR